MAAAVTDVRPIQMQNAVANTLCSRRLTKPRTHNEHHVTISMASALTVLGAIVCGRGGGRERAGGVEGGKEGENWEER